jgi:hypothetical protein
MAESNAASSSLTKAHSSSDIKSVISNLPNTTQFNIVKLDGPNYLAWVSQFLPIIRSYELMGLVDGSEPCLPKFLTTAETNEQTFNPAYVLWQKRDQHLLSWILCSLEPALISSMCGLNTSHLAWNALAERYASQSRSHISYLKRQLQNLQQGYKFPTSMLQTENQSFHPRITPSLQHHHLDIQVLNPDFLPHQQSHLVLSKTPPVALHSTRGLCQTTTKVFQDLAKSVAS